jgi:PRTRC genetic system protein E
MEFFQNLASLNLAGDLRFVVRNMGETLIVSVLLDSQDCADEAKRAVSPAIFRGTPAELDEGLFNELAKPVIEINRLFLNMDSYQKGLEEAKTQSAAGKAKENAEKKEREDRKKSFDALMKKVDELEAENKPREAYAKLPDDPASFPEHSTLITKRKKELLLKFSQPTLFN